jgi:hypothetical protein
MVLALTSGEAVLLVVAGVFITFALVVSMVVPRRWPEFPGRRLGLFTLAVLILFAGMLTAVVTATGGEEHGEAEHATATEGGSTEAETTGESTTESTETESTETETESTTTGETETEAETATEGESTETGGGGGGNAEAGAAVFASAGCTGCNTPTWTRSSPAPSSWSIASRTARA